MYVYACERKMKMLVVIDLDQFNIDLQPIKPPKVSFLLEKGGRVFFGVSQHEGNR